MKKLLIKIAIWFLNKCKTEAIQIKPGSYILFRGRFYHVISYTQTVNFSDSRLAIVAEEIHPIDRSAIQ